MISYQRRGTCSHRYLRQERRGISTYREGRTTWKGMEGRSVRLRHIDGGVGERDVGVGVEQQPAESRAAVRGPGIRGEG